MKVKDKKVKLTDQKKEIPQEKPLLELRNIKKTFSTGEDRIEALKGVNLEICPGEFVVINGPSGCGKTTLLNTILGLERPDEGHVLVSGEDMYDRGEDKRASFRREKFGVIRQQSDWIGALNVLGNVSFPLSIAGIPAEEVSRKAKEILYLFKFDKKERYSPLQLSGGEQQRLSVCRALISDPPILLADEPTGNLDSVSAESLMYDLKALNIESKKTMVLVTHNPDYERYATKYIYMEDGAIKGVREKGKAACHTAKWMLENPTFSTGSLTRKLLFLTKLAFKNFKKYKMRTLLTSGGVALSIGFITFLISLSIGFQNLSTEGIAKMEVFKILDVDTGKSEIVSIDQATINKMSNIFAVEKVYPLVSISSDFSYQGKNVRGIIYGRNSDALKIDRPRIIAGDQFSSDSADEILLNNEAAKDLGVTNNNSIVGSYVKAKSDIRPELTDAGGKSLKTVTKRFKVVGLVDEGNEPYVYAPLESLKKIGITKYSGAKVMATSPENVDKIKSLIEHMGFKVSSIKDTIDQAYQFFNVFKTILLIFGVIAVTVSCIGMFNTLTISLVEKTREIGVMKCMGATRKDVKKIFILEALFVGLIGGLSGILFSYLLGQFFNSSIYALAKQTGNNPVKIFVFTPDLLFYAILLSIFISVLTGIYPSRRASRISALNALRYE